MMREELIRLQDAACDLGRGQRLANYNLTVFKGEIVYVQGISGSGKTALERVLTGGSPLGAGTLYIDEVRCGGFDSREAHRKGIYAIGLQDPMVGRMTLFENLEVIRNVPFPFMLIKEKNSKEAMQKLLQQFGILRHPDILVEELPFAEKQLLCIIKAWLQGARLIIVNCTRNMYSSMDADKIGGAIRHLAGLGISFLFICERLHPFIRIADRVQVIHRGQDLFEWNGNDQFLADFSRTFPPREPSLDEEVSLPVREGKAGFLCILDYSWNFSGSFYRFLEIFNRENREIWQEYIPCKMPSENRIFDGESVIIPRQSASMLLNNLSLEDNLSICIPGRVGRGRLNIINREMTHVLSADFKKRFGISPEVQWPGQLSDIHKKILSIYRWTLAHPKAIFLESPFWGMDSNETRFLVDYLDSVQDMGIQIILFTNTKEDIADLKCNFIYTENGIAVPAK